MAPGISEKSCGTTVARPTEEADRGPDDLSENLRRRRSDDDTDQGANGDHERGGKELRQQRIVSFLRVSDLSH